MIDILPNELILEIFYYVDFIFVPFIPFVCKKFNEIVKFEPELRCLVFDLSTEPFHFLKSSKFFECPSLVEYLFKFLKPAKLNTWPCFYETNTEYLSSVPDWFMRDFIFKHHFTNHYLMTMIWDRSIINNNLSLANDVFLNLQNWITIDSWCSEPQFPKIKRMLENSLISQCNWSMFDRWFGYPRRQDIHDTVFFDCVIMISDLSVLKELIAYWCEIRRATTFAFWNSFQQTVKVEIKTKYVFSIVLKEKIDYLNYLYKHIDFDWFTFTRYHNCSLKTSYYLFLENHYSTDEIKEQVNSNRAIVFSLPVEMLQHLKTWENSDFTRKLMYQKAIESENKNHIMWFLIHLDQKEVPHFFFKGCNLIPTIEVILESGLIDINDFSSHCCIDVSKAIVIFEKFGSIFNFQVEPSSTKIKDLKYFNFWKQIFTNTNRIDFVIKRLFSKQLPHSSEKIHHIINFLKFIKRNNPDYVRSNLYRCGLDTAMKNNNSYSLVHCLLKYFNIDDEYKKWFPESKMQSRKLFLKLYKR